MDMRGSQRRAINHRRIGNKVMTLARVSAAIERKIGSMPTPAPAKKRRSFTFRLRLTKRLAFICAGIILVAGVATAGVLFYQKQAAAAAAKAAQIKFEAEKKEKASAMACRQQKLASKRELYGKVTYDELYDGNACDNLPQ